LNNYKLSKSIKPLPSGYDSLFKNLKISIDKARIKACLSVNRELIELYWTIGKEIVETQKDDTWGANVIEQISNDIKKSFPGIKGFSSRNIWRMRAFYLAYTKDTLNLPQPVAEIDTKNLPQPMAEIPWGHNIVLIEKMKEPSERVWYAKQTTINGWSRAVLTNQIESKLFDRQGKAITNFTKTLPPQQSDLAQGLFKDPYNFDFINFGTNISERRLESKLLQHLKDFLIEMGAGFSFVGSQYQFEVGDKDYYLDLLFYHLKLRCFIIIDLKIEEFKPEFAGKMGFYLSAVDDKLKHFSDEPSIGLILCKERNKVVVEYTLRDSNRPMGVATYKLFPEKMKSSLPTPEQLQQEFGKIDEKD